MSIRGELVLEARWYTWPVSWSSTIYSDVVTSNIILYPLSRFTTVSVHAHLSNRSCRVRLSSHTDLATEKRTSTGLNHLVTNHPSRFQSVSVRLSENVGKLYVGECFFRISCFVDLSGIVAPMASPFASVGEPYPKRQCLYWCERRTG